MKFVQLATMLVIALFALTGCGPKHGDESFKKQCFPSYWVQTPCGACLKDQCKHVCGTCSFNEPQCRACWSCLTSKGCNYNNNGFHSGYIDKEKYTKQYRKTGKHRFVGDHNKRMISY